MKATEIISKFFLMNKLNKIIVYSLLIILFALYWTFYPSLYSKFTTTYNLLIVFFIVIAPLLWGIWGGIVLLIIILTIRLILTKQYGLMFHGGVVDFQFFQTPGPPLEQAIQLGFIGEDAKLSAGIKEFLQKAPFFFQQALQYPMVHLISQCKSFRKCC